MKVQDIMTRQVVGIEPGESVEVAARQLTHYNIGALPVTERGKLCGMITDRDLVTRCVAMGRPTTDVLVRDVMTRQVVTVSPDMDTAVAAHLMGRQQIRRLPVVENGKLCGMVSLADMACREDCVMDAADALGDISDNISYR